MNSHLEMQDTERWDLVQFDINRQGSTCCKQRDSAIA